MKEFKEVVKLAPSIYVQASVKKLQIRRLSPFEVAPSCESFGDKSLEVTRQLLAGAFFAGLPKYSNKKQSEIPIDRKSPSLLRYIHSLASSYQTTHATPPVMRRVPKIFVEQGKHELAEYFLQVTREESGHDALALMDLKALGLPAETFVAYLRPQNALALVDHFTRLADSSEPISTLGYAYALERMALFNTEESISELEKLIPESINATRCLRVHSSAGVTEIKHVADSIKFISSLPRQDRGRIAQAVYETIKIQTEAESDYPGDDAMSDFLDEKFQWT